MKHLIISREYPPAPGGGIGTYVHNISRLLAEAGETVHVITQKWEGAEDDTVELFDGKLIIHRIFLQDWSNGSQNNMHPYLENSSISKELYHSGYFPQCFSYNAGLLAEKLIEEEGIDIVEAQEFEAPLYYLQLRRALGLGSKNSPPILVHLHTPTEYVARYNDWDIHQHYNIFADKFETYTINCSDALLSPSRFLANHIKNTYDTVGKKIQIIPYPIPSDISFIKRSNSTWEKGKITYVGRLERRKGVIEYIDAAVKVCREIESPKFYFYGSDVIEPDSGSVKEYLLSRIPDRFKSNFIFHGQVEHSEVNKILSDSKICVVPSRFENYPNTCIEAMKSGLPVVASPNGGMAEMIEDGISGWISEDLSVNNFSDTLKKALIAESNVLENMGLNASNRITGLCDNNKIIQSHLEFIESLLKDKECVTYSIPHSVCWKFNKLCTQISASDYDKNGIGIVLKGYNQADMVIDAIYKITKQSKAVSLVLVLIYDENVKNEIQGQLDGNIVCDVHYLDVYSYNFGKCIIEVINFFITYPDYPIGIAFIEENISLEDKYLEIAESILKKQPNIGVVSTWIYTDIEHDNLKLNSTIMFPYQYFLNQIISCSVIRTEAFINNRYLPAKTDSDMGYWEFFNSVLLNGWVSVNVPVVLCEVTGIKTKFDKLNRNITIEQIKRFSTEINDEMKNVFIYELILFISYIDRMKLWLNELEEGKNWFKKLSDERQEWIEVISKNLKEINNNLQKTNKELEKAKKYNIIDFYNRSLLKLKNFFGIK